MIGSLTVNEVVETFFRNHLRPIRSFYGAYLFSKSANSIFKILIDCSFSGDDFKKRYSTNYSITTTKNVVKFCTKLKSYLGTVGK